VALVDRPVPVAVEPAAHDVAQLGVLPVSLADAPVGPQVGELVQYLSSLCGSDWSAARVVGFEDGKVVVRLPDGSTARCWPEQVRP
jgi:hypothetical protein